MKPPRARALLATVCCALVAGACGGGTSHEEYGSELRDTMEELETAYGDALQGAEADAAGGARADLQTAKIALGDAARRLEEIEPPRDLVDEHRDLAEGVRGMAESVDLLIEAQRLAETDPSRAKQLTRQFASDDSFRQVQDAAARIQKAGIDVAL